MSIRHITSRTPERIFNMTSPEPLAGALFRQGTGERPEEKA